MAGPGGGTSALLLAGRANRAAVARENKREYLNGGVGDGWRGYLARDFCHICFLRDGDAGVQYHSAVCYLHDGKNLKIEECLHCT